MYERKRDKQVIYVLPSILDKLPVVPIGDTGTILFAMRQNADFVVTAFEPKRDQRRHQMVVHRHVGLELVPRTLREMKKLSVDLLLSYFFKIII